jgi:probable phosphomutase (TIGR03848 family)
MTYVLLIRHGHTAAVGRWLAVWLPGVGLTDTGRTQAESVARRVAALPIAAMYASPLERAMETASAIAARLRLPVIECADLGEMRVGDWSGRSFDELDHEPAWHAFNERRSITRPPGGETMQEVQQRMARAVRGMAERHPDAIVAAVSHADPIRAVVMLYLDIPIDLHWRLEISPASVTVISFDGGAARVGRVNDAGELQGLPNF